MTTLTIEPDAVHQDMERMHSHHWFVELPNGVAADRFEKPDIWSKVQGSRQKAPRLP